MSVKTYAHTNARLVCSQSNLMTVYYGRLFRAKHTDMYVHAVFHTHKAIHHARDSATLMCFCFRSLVPQRSRSTAIMAKGLYPGAHVKIGPDLKLQGASTN